RLAIDDHLELGGLLDRKVTGARALQNFVHKLCRAPEHVGKARSIRHQAARLDVAPVPEYRWQPALSRKTPDLSCVHIDELIYQRDQRIGTFPRNLLECP